MSKHECSMQKPLKIKHVFILAWKLEMQSKWMIIIIDMNFKKFNPYIINWVDVVVFKFVYYYFYKFRLIFFIANTIILWSDSFYCHSQWNLIPHFYLCALGFDHDQWSAFFNNLSSNNFCFLWFLEVFLRME